MDTRKLFAFNINNNNNVVIVVVVLSCCLLDHFINCSQSIEQLCSDCRLAGSSVEDLIRKPRQMDAYGQVEARIELDNIKKAVCRDIVNDLERERCRAFYFEHQSLLIKWKQQPRISYIDFICIKELKYCCPEWSYGPRCSKCPKCPLRGQQCLGEGTRTGNGSCICKPGHTGANCDTCLPGYYLSTRGPPGKATRVTTTGSKTNETGDVCEPCHRSCLYCRAAGPTNCEVCSAGYEWAGPEFGCSDIDECLSSGGSAGTGGATRDKQALGKGGPTCGPNSFCVNTEGSYFCYECDRACDGCHGDGPDMCLRCAHNYRLDPKTATCQAAKQTVLPVAANYFRYAIYAGLCLCTCIILHTNVYLASLIGLGVAMYISVSEYIMSSAGHLDAAGQQHQRLLMDQQKQLLGNQLAQLGLV